MLTLCIFGIGFDVGRALVGSDGHNGLLSHVIENVIIEVAKEYYDNAKVWDKTSVNMRMASEWYVCYKLWFLTKCLFSFCV